MNLKIEHIFKARSIAIFGASDEFGKVGTLIMNNLVSCDYQGKVYPINPKHAGKKFFDYQVYADLEDVPDKVDFAVIVVPKQFVNETIKKCIEHNIQSAIVVPAGYAEVDEDGKKMQSELVKMAENGNFIFMGPNSMGVWSSEVSMNINMGYMSPEPGDVTIISQSGSMGVLVCSNLMRRKIGIRAFVSSGNEACLTFEDYLHYFINDEKTKIIGTFLETFRKNKEFFEICKMNLKSNSPKPIIILKAGSTNAGRRAAISHTGSISGSDKIFEGFIKQYGIIRAYNYDQLINLISGFKCISSLPIGNRVAIIPGAGGAGVLLADACEKLGLNVAKPSEELLEKVNKYMPSYWSHNNPFDPAGSQDFRVYTNTLKLIYKSGEYDCVITNAVELESILGLYNPKNETALNAKEKMLEFARPATQELASNEIKLIKKYEIPTIFVSDVYPYSNIFDIFNENKILVVRDPDNAAFVLSEMFKFNKIIKAQN